MNMEKNHPISPVEPIQASDNATKVKDIHIQDAPAAASPSVKAAASAPALHVAPAAHAAITRADPAAAAAVSEERGRWAVERIAGSTPVHAVHAGPTPHAVLTLRPHLLAHVHGDFWRVLEDLRQANANEILFILSQHPEVARDLAQVLLLAGGASALEALHHGRPTAEVELPRYSKPTPDTPEA